MSEPKDALTQLARTVFADPEAEVVVTTPENSGDFYVEARSPRRTYIRIEAHHLRATDGVGAALRAMMPHHEQDNPVANPPYPFAPSYPPPGKDKP